MDLFDYRVRDKSRYISSGITPGTSKKPVAKGSTSSFKEPYSSIIEPGSFQFIVEPAEDDVLCARFNWKRSVSFGGRYHGRYHDPYFLTDIQDLVGIRYLQNGVYSVEFNNDRIRVVSSTGPVAVKLVFMTAEIYLSIDGATIRLPVENAPVAINASIAPEGGVLYDKIIRNQEIPVDELVVKNPHGVAGSAGYLTPVVRDKWYEPVVISSEDMQTVDQYHVFARGAAVSRTAAAFLSDTTRIEKSYDGDEWEPVDKVEYHGNDRPIFRSQDSDFTIEMFNTTMTDFLAKGMTTETTGAVYKVGKTIGSYFSHDCYRIIDGGIRIESENMTSVSILGYISDEAVSRLNPVIDYNGDNFGKMHLYTFEADQEFELIDDEIYIAALGKNLEHEGVMDLIVGRPEVSYADEIGNLELGMSANGDNEYAILDLQWGL